MSEKRAGICSERAFSESAAPEPGSCGAGETAAGPERAGAGVFAGGLFGPLYSEKDIVIGSGPVRDHVEAAAARGQEVCPQSAGCADQRRGGNILWQTLSIYAGERGNKTGAYPEPSETPEKAGYFQTDPRLALRGMFSEKAVSVVRGAAGSEECETGAAKGRSFLWMLRLSGLQIYQES